MTGFFPFLSLSISACLFFHFFFSHCYCCYNLLLLSHDCSYSKYINNKLHGKCLNSRALVSYARTHTHSNLFIHLFISFCRHETLTLTFILYQCTLGSDLIYWLNLNTHFNFQSLLHCVYSIMCTLNFLLYFSKWIPNEMTTFHVNVASFIYSLKRRNFCGEHRQTQTLYIITFT